MPRRALVASMWLCAFAGIAGATAMLAPPAREAPAGPALSQGELRVAGKGASTGRVTAFTLHAAHVGAAPAIACGECHEIRPEGFAKPGRDRCLACHPERDLALHRSVDDAAARECTSCHDFLDAQPTATAAWQCGRCHAKPHDDPALLGKDPRDACGRCHSPHGARAATAPTCTGCHEDHATRHRADDDPASGACLVCHRRHDPAANARARCAPCHRDRAPRIPDTATFARGHDCTGCHAPHAFAKDEVRACTSCHGAHAALAAAAVPEHARCRSCHDPHAPKTAAAACAGCHPDVHPEHPTSCIGCHPPHTGGDSGLPVVACSSCHTRAHDDRAFHRGARCVDCHRPHGFKRAFGAVFCLGCHAGRVGTRPAIAPSAGHADCGQCHQRDPHDPAAPPACGTCHAAQASTAPRGHATCARCHDVHAGTLRPNVATCVGCHADRARGPHVAIAGGCERCHRPHAPGPNATPPACTTCHAAATLRGMHAVRGHATCTSCHQPHGAPFPDRATCLTCHADHVQHEPTATSCTGCHTFGGPS